MSQAIEAVEVQTAAGTVAVHVLGTGLPVVLWHGLYADSSSWGYVLPALLTGRRLLVVDGPGWGRSARLRPGTGRSEVAAAARQVIETLSPGRAVDWVGNGWGGRVGLELAARSPELVRSLVVAMADPAPMRADERRRVRRTLRALRIVGPVGSVGRTIIADQLSPASRTEPQAVGSVLDALLLAGRLQAARSVERFDVRRSDVTDLFPLVTAPLLLVGGDGASPHPGPAAEEVAALAPFARSVTVPGARAQIALDRPAELSRAVREFWSDLQTPS
jgi:pimeloyl-ACP methyl ester carboxylesterase